MIEKTSTLPNFYFWSISCGQKANYISGRQASSFYTLCKISCGGPQPHRRKKYQARNRPAPQAKTYFRPAPARGLWGPRAWAGQPTQGFTVHTSVTYFLRFHHQIMANNVPATIIYNICQFQSVLLSIKDIFNEFIMSSCAFCSLCVGILNDKVKVYDIEKR